MNIYQRMMMQSLTPQQVARAAFGARAMSTPTVVKTDVQSLFNKGARARSVMSEHLPYVLGQSGVGLGGLGAFAAGAKNELLPGVSFATDWGWEWWNGESPWSRHVNFWDTIEDYSPPDPDLLRRAQERWTNLASMVRDVPEADALLTKYKNQLQTLANTVDGLIRQFNWGLLPVHEKASDATQNALVRTYKQINETLERFIREPLPRPPTASAPPVDGAPPTGTAPGTYSRKDEEEMLKKVLLDRAKQNALNRANQDAQGKSAALTTRGSGLPSWLLPAGVGVALIGGFFLLRKKG